jgi:hypothetical protein
VSDITIIDRMREASDALGNQHPHQFARFDVAFLAGAACMADAGSAQLAEIKEELKRLRIVLAEANALNHHAE